MPGYYTVVQYVPDPVRDERINVGVIVYGDGRLRGRFLDDWRRAAHFGQSDLRFLRDFAYSVEQASAARQALPGLEASDRLDEATLHHIMGRWINSIQFTPARASLDDPDSLLDQVAARFLSEPRSRGQTFRDRGKAAQILAASVRTVLNRKYGRSVARIIQRNYRIDGELDQHQFDTAIANGRVYLAGHALSFETPDKKVLERDLQITSYAVSDVLRHDRRIQVGVLVLPPPTVSVQFVRAQAVFQKVGATLVTERDVEEWAARVSDALPSQAFIREQLH